MCKMLEGFAKVRGSIECTYYMEQVYLMAELQCMFYQVKVS